MSELHYVKKITVAGLVSASLLVGGCAGTNPVTDVKRVFTGVPTEARPGMSPEQMRLLRLTAESEKIRGQATLAGLGAGAALGLLFCKNKISVCTAVATAGGAGVGYFAGYYVAQKKNNAEAEQLGIKESIDGAQESMKFYEARAQLAKTVVVQNRNRITKLNQSSIATEALRKDYGEKLLIMEEDRDRISAAVSQMSADLSFMDVEINGRKKFKNEDTSALEKRKEALEKINTRLRAQLDQMNAELDRVPDTIKSAA